MWLVLSVVLSVGAASAHEEFQIASGVRLVETPGSIAEERSVDGSLVGHFRQFLATHELQVKLDEILPAHDDVQRGLKGALEYLNGLDSNGTAVDDESGRGSGGGLGGKKGGGGAILMMATMMGGTMAALGFGAVGMLAMKALTVSAMALMLSAVIGLKKLLSKGDDDGGHSVSYIPVHHGGGHRRRRDLPPTDASDATYLAYAAYAPYTS